MFRFKQYDKKTHFTESLIVRALKESTGGR